MTRSQEEPSTWDRYTTQLPPPGDRLRRVTQKMDQRQVAKVTTTVRYRLTFNLLQNQRIMSTKYSYRSARISANWADERLNIEHPLYRFSAPQTGG